MNLARITTNLVIAFVVGGFVFVGLIRAASAADPNNWECKPDQFCDAVPVCPTGTGECNYCSDAIIMHWKCFRETGKSCVTDLPVPGGCGVEIEGVCDVNNNCIYTVTEDPCGRRVCHDPSVQP